MSFNTPRMVAAFLSVLAFAAVSGCRAVPTSPYTSMLSHQQTCCLNNVHAIFVESPVDVFDFGGVKAVATSVKQAGCSNVEIVNFHRGGTAERLAARIRQIQNEGSASRIILVGFSSGTLIVERALKELEAEGRRVDSTVYIDSEILSNFGMQTRPMNSDRNLLVYRDHARVPENIPAAELYRVDEYFHLSVPCSQTCLDVIGAEIVHLATEGCPCPCHAQADQLAALSAGEAESQPGQEAAKALNDTAGEVPAVQSLFPELPIPEPAVDAKSNGVSAE